MRIIKKFDGKDWLQAIDFFCYSLKVHYRSNKKDQDLVNHCVNALSHTGWLWGTPLRSRRWQLRVRGCDVMGKRVREEEQPRGLHRCLWWLLNTEIINIHLKKLLNKKPEFTLKNSLRIPMFSSGLCYSGKWIHKIKRVKSWKTL